MSNSQELFRVIRTPQGAVTIRPSRPEDVQAYRQLRLEALKNHPEAFTSDYETVLAWTPGRWVERLGAAGAIDQKITYLAETGGELAGMGGAFRGDSPKTAHTATIVGIYVRPEWRGYGLGEAIVDACEDWARQNDIRILKLAVMSANTPALQIYIRCGYKVYGVDPRSVLVGGVYYDEILMTKELA